MAETRRASQVATHTANIIRNTCKFIPVVGKFGDALAKLLDAYADKFKAKTEQDELLNLLSDFTALFYEPLKFFAKADSSRARCPIEKFSGNIRLILDRIESVMEKCKNLLNKYVKAGKFQKTFSLSLTKQEFKDLRGSLTAASNLIGDFCSFQQHAMITKVYESMELDTSIVEIISEGLQNMYCSQDFLNFRMLPSHPKRKLSSLLETFVQLDCQHSEVSQIDPRLFPVLKPLLSENNSIVVGNAGFGKSTLATVVACICANTVTPIKALEANPMLSNVVRRGFPLLVRLRHYFALEEQKPENKVGFLHYVFRRLNRHWDASSVPFSSFKSFVTKLPRVYLILDGLDEVDHKDIVKLTEAMNKIIESFAAENQLKVVITTRPASLDILKKLPVPDPVVLQLRPLSNEMIFESFEKHAHCLFKDQRIDMLQRFKGSFDTLSDDLKSFLRVPLHVSMAVMVLREKITLNPNRYLFFSEFCDVIFKREAEVDRYDGSKSGLAQKINEFQDDLKETHEILAYKSYVDPNFHPPIVSKEVMDSALDEVFRNLDSKTQDDMKMCVTTRLTMVKDSSEGFRFEFQIKPLCAFYAANYMLSRWSKNRAEKIDFQLTCDNYNRWRDVIEFLLDGMFQTKYRNDVATMFKIILESTSTQRENLLLWSGEDQFAIDILCHVQHLTKQQIQNMKMYLVEIAKSIFKLFLLNLMPGTSPSHYTHVTLHIDRWVEPLPELPAYLTPYATMTTYAKALVKLAAYLSSDEVAKFEDLLHKSLKVSLAASALVAWMFSLAYLNVIEKESKPDYFHLEPLIKKNIPTPDDILSTSQANLFAFLAIQTCPATTPFWKQFATIPTAPRNDWSGVRYMSLPVLRWCVVIHKISFEECSLPPNLFSIEEETFPMVLTDGVQEPAEKRKFWRGVVPALIGESYFPVNDMVVENLSSEVTWVHEFHEDERNLTIHYENCLLMSLHLFTLHTNESPFDPSRHRNRIDSLTVTGNPSEGTIQIPPVTAMEKDKSRYTML
eukprot:m.307711 g.307711  ORF g.307711 m.307711 type:complete len:1014 (-) comp16463_c2_seq2:141-3182(-)